MSAEKLVQASAVKAAFDEWWPRTERAYDHDFIAMIDALTAAEPPSPQPFIATVKAAYVLGGFEREVNTEVELLAVVAAGCAMSPLGEVTIQQFVSQENRAANAETLAARADSLETGLEHPETTIPVQPPTCADLWARLLKLSNPWRWHSETDDWETATDIPASFWCDWCGVHVPSARRSVTPPHPDNGCLWSDAIQAAPRADTGHA